MHRYARYAQPRFANVFVLDAQALERYEKERKISSGIYFGALFFGIHILA